MWGRFLVGLACLALFAAYVLDLAGTDFARDTVTGSLLVLNAAGMGLMILALAIGFRFPRGAGRCILLVLPLCLPLYLYPLMPGLVRRYVPGAYAVPTTSDFIWDGAALLRIAALLVLEGVYLRPVARPYSPAPQAFAP